MKNWLKENWFKLVIALGAIIIGASVFYYFVILSHQEEARIQEQDRIDLIKKNKETLEKQQKGSWDSFVNNCITDAYTELKTLQGNFDMNSVHFCSLNSENCSQWKDGNDKAKAEAFTRYEKEWVPQCKLGNRVFGHYEPYPTPNN